MSISYVSSNRELPEFCELEKFSYKLEMNKKKNRWEYHIIGFSCELLKKHPILNDAEYLEIKYPTKEIEINKITMPVVDLAKKMLKNGWLINKNRQWNKHFKRLEIAANNKVVKIKNKNSDVHSKIYDELYKRIQQDRQYKLWRLQWEYEHRPCLLIINYKDDKLELLAKVSEELIKNIHPGVGVDLLIEAYHEYYSLDDIAEQFDLVLLLDVIEHLELGDGVQMLKRLNELLVEGGMLIINTPNIFNPSRFWLDATHKVAYSYEELGGIVLSQGFDVLEIYRTYNDSFPKYYFRLILCYPLHRILNVDFAKSILILACKQKHNG